MTGTHVQTSHPSAAVFESSCRSTQTSTSRMDCNLIVLFGPTADDYLITYGEQVAYSNSPSELLDLLKNNAEYNPMRMGWIS